MKTEDIINLPASPGNGGENNEHNQHVEESSNLDVQSGKLEIEEVKEIGEISGSSGGNANGDNQLFLVADNGNNMIDDPRSLEISFESSETVTVTKKRAYADNGCPTEKDAIFLSNHQEDEFPPSEQEIGASSLSGVKRPRITVDEEQPLVKVTYKSLTSDSKRKLKELLQQWSQWHAQHCSASPESGKILESGEDTYFPAIQVGLHKSSAVSFWMENETRNNVNKEPIPLDENSVPLYDRGFSLALTSMDGSSNLGGLEIVEGSRCFNCGSYNHSLKDCPKPRDNIAVTNARKQHIARRNQNSSSRNVTRYYQNSPGGKYDGLRPGTLDSGTRQLLGLGELDPPPWLNRMREIGYPPGYLDSKDEDQPSGITIFGDDENVEDTEEGEILEMSFAEPDKRMTVDFPGVNAPIPENADEMLWAAGPSDSTLYRNRSYSRYNQTSNSGSRSHYHDQRDSGSRSHHHDQRDSGSRSHYHDQRDSGSRSHYHDQRLSRGFEDDEPPPPGCEDGSPRMFSNYRRYGVFDSPHSSYVPRDSPISRSSNFGRSLSDRTGSR